MTSMEASEDSGSGTGMNAIAGRSSAGDVQCEAEKELLFEKCLTSSDVGKLHCTVNPTHHAEKRFPTISINGRLLLCFDDDDGKFWRFRFFYWKHSQSYVVTWDWSKYVKEKHLRAGDVVLFHGDRTNRCRFFISCRKRRDVSTAPGGVSPSSRKHPSDANPLSNPPESEGSRPFLSSDKQFKGHSSGLRSSLEKYKKGLQHNIMDQPETSIFSNVTQSAPVFNGENYQVWAARMQAYLEGADLWEAVEEDYEILPLPANPTVTQLRNHKEKVTKKAKAKSCMFNAVSPSILIKIMKKSSAKLMWDYLKTEYEGDERLRGMKVLNLLRDFEMQRMKGDETVKDYADRLIGIINNIRILGTVIGDDKIVQKILVSVPERFEATIATLENTKELTALKLPEVLSALQAQEQRRIMRSEESVEGALKAKVKGKGPKKGKKKKSPEAGNQKQYETSEEANSSQNFSEPCKHCNKKGHPHWRCWRNPNVKCRNCNKLGHIERFCREKPQQRSEARTAETGDTENLFVASCYASHSVKGGWLVDSGCTNHMTGDRRLFKNLDTTFSSKVKIGNGDFIAVEGKGDVKIKTSDGNKVLSEVLFVPRIDQNLLSVAQLISKGYRVVFDKDECIIGHNTQKFQFRIKMRDNSFSFNPEATDFSALKSQMSQDDIWHKRLGHFHDKGVSYMIRNQLMDGLPETQTNSVVCKVCPLGKQKRLPFSSSNWRANEKLQLVHTDVCGPMPEESLTGSKYFIIFIDDFSRMCWIYFLKQKTEVDEVFEKFKTEVENECEKKIKTIRSDNGTEYTSGKFREICEKAGIKHQFSVPYSPQQNGVSERKNRTIVEMARCLMYEKNLPKRFWAEASSTAVFLLNRFSTKALQKSTPYEVWFGRKPTCSNFKIFGCICFSFVPDIKRDKLDKKSEVGIFVGYSLVSKAYRIYLPNSNKVIVSRDVKFLELDEWDWSSNAVLSRNGQEVEPELQESDGGSQSETEEQDGMIDNQPDDEGPVRGTRTLEDIYNRCNVAVLEPSNFEEAKRNQKWMSAMEEELKMIQKTGTWKLVDKPVDKKVIGVKWVYKTKYNPDGSVNKYKARLVVKGYAQVWGVDFSETFAPVARLDTIRLLLTLAAQLKWKVFHMDVKSAFLNGELKEETYVEQPDGFKVQGMEDKVYLLKKALYGLRQAPRAWYERIDQCLTGLKFNKSHSEHTLYIKRGNGLVVVSLYVDDLLVTGDNAEEIESLQKLLSQEFEMTNLGLMSQFLGLEIVQDEEGIFIGQQKYLKQILRRFNMEDCKIMKTPLDPKSRMQKFENSEAVSEVHYRSMIGCLMYLTASRPDILFAVNTLSRYLNCARKEHLVAAKRVLRYLKGTLTFGLRFSGSKELKLEGFVDSDWAGSVDDMKSTSGYCFSLGSAIFSWSSKKQGVVAQSTAEAEFVAATEAVNQAIWLRKILNDLSFECRKPTEILIDNQAAISISNNPVFHGKTKHFKVKFYFLREVQKDGEIVLVYCKTEDQKADLFTKGFHPSRFEELRRMIGMSATPSAKEEYVGS